MMMAIVFWLVYGVLWLISLLPLKILYILSDLLYLKVYYIFRYRKNVVFENLRNAFPEKTEAERTVIAKKFYRHFTDQIFETIKIISIKQSKIPRYIRIKNKEILDELATRNKSILVATGHYGNWEWLSLLNNVTYPFQSQSLYKPLNNKYIDKQMKKIRERTGSILIPIKDTLKVIVKNKNENKLVVTCFIADQSPMKIDIQYWTNFLNQPTPIYLGIEKIAKLIDQPVVFIALNKICRGNYEVILTKITENPKSLTQFEITEQHTRLLEKVILEKPEYWLWSHRRWKHKGLLNKPKDHYVISESLKELLKQTDRNENE